MSQTTVINIRTLRQQPNGAVILPPDHIYIGRHNPGYHVQSSPFANPFTLPRLAHSDARQAAIRKYEDWITSNLQLVERARIELRGKVLVCWCKPEACHGDVLVKIADCQW